MTKLTLFIAGLLSVGLIGNVQGMEEKKNDDVAIPKSWDRGHVWDAKLYSLDQEWQNEDPKKWFVGFIWDSELKKTLGEKEREIVECLIKKGINVPGAEFKVVSRQVDGSNISELNSELKDVMKPAGSRLVLCITCSFFRQ